MELNDYNIKAVNDVYKNAHIALQSISDLLPDVENEGMKKELQDEYEGYEKVIGEISAFMTENGIEPKDINPIKKAMMWSGIKMNTMFDTSRTHIAEIMIKGTVMGITELTAMKNEREKLDEKVVEQITKLLALEEKYEQRLKKFL
jgi:hypothetical protein